MTFNSKKPFDLVLSFLDANIVGPDFFIDIQKNIFTVNFSCNYHQFEDLHKEIAPYIGLNTYVSFPHKNKYDEVGANCYWLPFAANPRLYKNNKNKLKNISFIGTSYGERPYYLWRILQNSIPIDIYGPHWVARSELSRKIKRLIFSSLSFIGNTKNKLRYLDKNKRLLLLEILKKNYKDFLKGPLNDKEMIDIYGSSKIILNFSESRINHDYFNSEVLFGCNHRDFEVPMSGALLLTQHSDELEFFFDEGKEVISFKNEFEMIDKIKYYMSNDDIRKKIAVAGYQKALKEHTWVKRFEDLFDHLHKNYSLNTKPI